MFFILHLHSYRVIIVIFNGYLIVCEFTIEERFQGFIRENICVYHINSIIVCSPLLFSFSNTILEILNVPLAHSLCDTPTCVS
jgi:hypothetical protein